MQRCLGLCVLRLHIAWSPCAATTLERKSHTFVPVHYHTLVLATVRDVTEEYESHRRMKEAKDRSEALSQAKLSFLANTSHEIRTPLNAIITGSELLAKIPGMSNEQIELNSMVTQSSHALLALVSDVLDFSKIDADKLELETHPFVLESCIDLPFEMQSFTVRRFNTVSVIIVPTVSEFQSV